MGGDPNAMGGDDRLTTIVSQLSDDDIKAVENYADSLLNREEDKDEENSEMGAPMQTGMDQQGAPGAAQQGVMMEITKGQLKKLHEILNESEMNETFGDMLTAKRGDRNTEKKEKKIKKNINFRTPFDSPLV